MNLGHVIIRGLTLRMGLGYSFNNLRADHQLLQLITSRISSKREMTEFKMKLKTLGSDEGIKLDSGKGTKIFLNKRPDTYVVEIVGENNSNMNHSSENIQFIQNIDDVIALVVKTLGKSFSIIEY